MANSLEILGRTAKRFQRPWADDALEQAADQWSRLGDEQRAGSLRSLLLREAADHAPDSEPDSAEEEH